MQPLIGLHLALLIFLGWISTCNGSTNNFREKSDNLKYIERKRNTVTNSATEFLKFNVIHPQIYHVREKRELMVENIHNSWKLILYLVYVLLDKWISNPLRSF